MQSKLELKHLSVYLPYGLKVQLSDEGRFNLDNEYPNEHQFKSGLITEFTISDGESIYGEFKVSDRYYFSFNELSEIKPLLRPLSSLTKEINWGNQTYTITDLFEIGDDGGFIYEYDHGNIKLISQLKTIAEYNYHHDINYLPYPVVQVLIEHHFDVFGLIDRGLALPIDGKEVEGE